MDVDWDEEEKTFIAGVNSDVNYDGELKAVEQRTKETCRKVGWEWIERVFSRTLGDMTSFLSYAELKEDFEQAIDSVGRK